MFKIFIVSLLTLLIGIYLVVIDEEMPLGIVSTLAGLITLITVGICGWHPQKRVIVVLPYEHGRCAKCTQVFGEQNPDGGGGMCRECWARSH
jgi:hypothetical protein